MTTVLKALKIRKSDHLLFLILVIQKGDEEREVWAQTSSGAAATHSKYWTMN